jgi:hypothetical protein
MLAAFWMDNPEATTDEQPMAFRTLVATFALPRIY